MRTLTRCRSRIHGKGGLEWTGQRYWSVPREDFQTELASIWADVWTFSSSYASIVPKEVEGWERDPQDPGKSLIIATYGYYNWLAFPVGRAIMTVWGVSRPVRMTEGLDGELIEGTTIENKETFLTKPVEKDSNIGTEHLSTVTFQTAYHQNDIQWQVIESKIGKVNSNTLTQLGAGPRTMLLVKAGLPKVYLSALLSQPSVNPWGGGGGQNPIVPVQYIFWKKPGGWKGTINVQKWRKAPRRIPVLLENSLDHWVLKDDETNAYGTTDKTKALHRVIMVDIKEEAEGDVPILREVSFSDLYNLVQW